MATSMQLIDRLRRAQIAILRDHSSQDGGKYVELRLPNAGALPRISLTDAQFDCLVNQGINANSPREPNLMIQKLIECGVIDTDALG